MPKKINPGPAGTGRGAKASSELSGSSRSPNSKNNKGAFSAQPVAARRRRELCVDYMLEPVLIYFGKDKWTHPEIEEVLNFTQDARDGGFWASNEDIYRITIKVRKKICCEMAVRSSVISSYLKYEAGLAQKRRMNARELTAEIGSLLCVVLVEDIWSPGSEQFCFTKFGKKLWQGLGATQEQWKIWVNPDIGISRDRSGEYSVSNEVLV
jgi:hypothetical protein